MLYLRLTVIGLLLLMGLHTTTSAPVCGVNLILGRLSMNCSGFVSITYKDTTTTHSCDEHIQDFVYRSPVMITKGKCSGVLLDYDPSEYPKTPTDMYFVFFLITLSILILVTIPLIIIIVFIQRVGCSGGDDVVFGKKVTLNARHSRAVYTWSQVILVALCIQPGRAFCVPPRESTASQEKMIHTFALALNEAACFHNGSMINRGNKLVHEVTHLYESVYWSHHSSTRDGCGWAQCGSKEDCDSWGELGKVMVNEDKQTIELKQCVPHRRAIFSCFYAWGCWLVSKQILLSNRPRVQVYSIGGHSSHPNITTAGHFSCNYREVAETSLDNLRGMSLLIGDKSWICPGPSPLGQPKHSSPGDLQISKDGNITFDFSGFQCETMSAVSSGQCRVVPSFLSLASSHCVQLPGFVGSSWVEFLNDSLVSTQHDPLIIQAECEMSEKVISSPQDCYGLKVSIQGVEAEDHLSVVAMSARSYTPDSILIVESNCSQEAFTIPCDGQMYGFPLLHAHIRTCLFNSELAEDVRKQPASFDWEWDHPDVESPISHHSAMTTITFVIIIIVLCLIKILCN